jgi:hypothetical protein
MISAGTGVKLWPSSSAVQFRLPLFSDWQIFCLTSSPYQLARAQDQAYCKSGCVYPSPWQILRTSYALHNATRECPLDPYFVHRHLRFLHCCFDTQTMICNNPSLQFVASIASSKQDFRSFSRISASRIRLNLYVPSGEQAPVNSNLYPAFNNHLSRSHFLRQAGF